jgi:hypothetical protein
MMLRTGFANLPLHPGKAPYWLFLRMVDLSGAIAEAVVSEYGTDEFLRRLSDPYWFQGLGCVIGFDWHSSGLSTTTCGALKVALGKIDMGIRVAGGKGIVSRRTPVEISEIGDFFALSDERIARLRYSSLMSAKVDNSLIQDNYDLYHHCFFVSDKGRWSVVQQGMDCAKGYARRYHWLCSRVDSFVDEPDQSICCEERKDCVLDMTSKDSKDAKKISLDIVKDGNFGYFIDSRQRTLPEFFSSRNFSMKRGHYITDMRKTNIETLKRAYEFQPKDYEEFVGLRGVGAKTIRSLALVSELVYGKPASWDDPVKYSFAHGGKDGIPYPVDKETYDSSVCMLRNAIRQSKLGDKDKLMAIKRLSGLYS